MINLTEKPFYLKQNQIRWVEETEKQLTLEQKVGQLFCVMGGAYEKNRLTDMAAQSRIGGVLFRPDTTQQIQKNYQALDAAAMIPLLKAANLEEGGAGAISDGTLFGWPMMVGAADEDQMVEKFARVCAAEGQRVGINWTFSPVCDLDLNYLNPITNVRTYGSDKARVKKNTEIFAATVQNCGMAACAKHFPGDGVDYRDQHLHPTYNSLSAEAWYSSYGEIYQNLIEHDLMSIMAGHIVQPEVAMEINPQLTFADCLPASMSKEMLTGVLRERFGFNGVITTDATIMGGYCMAMERRKALPATLMAGCDMFVFNTDFEEDYQYILDGIRDGLVTEERIDEAVTRILALKACVCEIPGVNTPEKLPESEIDAEAWHRECAEKSATLVKNLCPEKLPVTKDRYNAVRLIILGKDEIPGGSMKETAQKFLEDRGFAVEVYEPFADDLHGSGQLDKSKLTMYLANYEQASNQTTVRIQWCEKHALDTPRFLNEEDCIFISFANPYLLQDAPRVKTYINAYTATKTTIEVVLEKLLGEGHFEGVSPVDAFCGLPDTRI